MQQIACSNRHVVRSRLSQRGQLLNLLVGLLLGLLLRRFGLLLATQRQGAKQQKWWNKKTGFARSQSEMDRTVDIMAIENPTKNIA